MENFVKTFYCQAVSNITTSIQKFDIPYVPSNDSRFSLWYDSLEAGTSYSVSKIFLYEYFKVMQENRNSTYFPLFYVQWPGGKQKILDGINSLEKLLSQHFTEIDPNYCLNGYLLDLRAATYCYDKQTNKKYTIMWNADKIESILKQQTKDDLNFWNLNYEAKDDITFEVENSTKEKEEINFDILDELNIPKLSNPKIQLYNCYGTNVWKDIFGKSFYLFNL